MGAEPKVWTVVLAGGASVRFGGAKQFETVGGVTLLERAIRVAQQVTQGVVVVVPRGNSWTGSGVDAVVTGGGTRAESVRGGMSAVPREIRIIVIHDAAHPLASPSLFHSVIDEVLDGADAAVPGLAVVEALRTVEDGWMVDDLDRSRVVLVQMPQAFEAQILRRVHADAPEAVEDSLLVRRSGGRVRVVPGDPANIHVTTRSDLDLVRAVERGRQ